jgi:pyridoxine 5-phosphate synthase
MNHKLKLGVNIDHIATLRQARGEGSPDIIEAAKLAIAGGADSIVAHLREDRRHIQDRDVYSIRKLTCPSVRRETRFDLEMAATDEMLKIALDVKPDMATIVPEKRKELTTEGGLDVISNLARLKEFAKELEASGVRVSLFIDPIEDQIRASRRTGASFIEIHTGKYARSNSKKDLAGIARSVILAKKLGLRVNAGHGLDYDNVSPVAKLDGIEEFNIGFSIIARSVFVGLKKAVSDMKKLLLFFVVFGLLCSCAYSQGVPGWLKNLGVSAEASTIEAVPEKPLFRDVPPDHWAASSVNDLVRMGITQGYPDGTFRGGNYISRYETAVFLSKMAHAGDIKAEKSAADEKLLEELRAEVYKLKYTVNLFKRPPEKKKNPVSAAFYSRAILGNIVSANAASSIINARLGPVVDYRLVASYKQEFDEDTFVRVGMDTMDSARSGGRDFAREMLEGEAQVKAKWGLGVNMTSGPGLVIHREGAINIFPSEDYRAYIRPNNGIKVFYAPGDLDTGLGYRATAVSTSGAASVNDVYGYVGYKFKKTFTGDVTLRYSMDLFNNDLNGKYATAESTINMYELIVSPTGQLDFGLKLGFSGSQNIPHNQFAGLSIVAEDLFRSGSSIKIYANKIGSEFFDFPTYQAMTGANLFDKLYQSGTYDIGLEISQVVSKTLSFKMISDIVTGPTGLYGRDEPNSNATFELDMDYGLFEGANMTFGFRTYQNPSATTNATSDMLMLGFGYNY